MTEITTLSRQVYKDFNIEGDPTSGDYKPEKSLIRTLFATIDAFISSSGAGFARYALKSSMVADLTRDDGQLGYVYADPTPSNNTIYQFNKFASPQNWSVALWYYDGVAAVVQPLVDEVNAAVALAGASYIGRFLSDVPDTQLFNSADVHLATAWRTQTVGGTGATETLAVISLDDQQFPVVGQYGANFNLQDNTHQQRLQLLPPYFNNNLPLDFSDLGFVAGDILTLAIFARNLSLDPLDPANSSKFLNFGFTMGVNTAQISFTNKADVGNGWVCYFVQHTLSSGDIANTSTSGTLTGFLLRTAALATDVFSGTLACPIAFKGDSLGFIRYLQTDLTALLKTTRTQVICQQLRGRLKAYVGDSRTFQGLVGTSTKYLVNRSYIHWERMLSGQAFDTTIALNFGRSGYTSAQLLALLPGDIATMQAAGVSDVNILASTNDRGGNASFTGSISGTTLTATSIVGAIKVGSLIAGTGVTANTRVTADLGGGSYTLSISQTVASRAMTCTFSAADSLANLQAMVNLITAAGMRVFILNETPRGDLTGSIKAEHVAVRNGINAMHAPFAGVVVVHSWEPLADSGDPDEAASWATVDFVHPTVRACYHIGLASWTSQKAIHPEPRPILPFDAEQGIYQYANMLSNAFMAGSGSVADDWAYTNNSGGTAAATSSLVTIGQDIWQKAVITGTPSGNDNSPLFFRWTQSIDTFAGQFLSGDTIDAALEVMVENPAGVRSLDFFLVGVNILDGAADIGGTNAGYQLGPDNYSGVLRSLPWALTADLTSLQMRIRIVTKDSTACGGNFYWRRGTIRRLNR